ncbi:MAG TPA: hypothetical protein DCE78_13315 [Bacteroidetes bacterium]|nr:hypothetical protein [Bacteroidota bacterium]
MNKSINTETVFEILAEGGGISIQRERGPIGDVFIYHHNEYDPVDDIFIIKRDEYSSFEVAFNRLNDHYSWYRLHLNIVHPEFREYIADRLIDALNKYSVTDDQIELSIKKLEKALNISIKYEINDKRWDWEYFLH